MSLMLLLKDTMGILDSESLIEMNESYIFSSIFGSSSVYKNLTDC